MQNLQPVQTSPENANPAYSANSTNSANLAKKMQTLQTVQTLQKVQTLQTALTLWRGMAWVGQQEESGLIILLCFQN